MSILAAIADAIPHEPDCPGEGAKCICGAVKKRNVLYVRVNDHISKITRNRVYLTNEAS